jgi:DNA-binding transcriptional MocR family regulator
MDGVDADSGRLSRPRVPGYDSFELIERGDEVVPSVAGLRIATRFRDPSVDDRAVCQAAAASGVGVEPLSTRYVDGRPAPGLVVGFGRIDADSIPGAVSLLAGVIRQR